MKRIWIAGIYIGGVTVPAVAMTLFLFGCCALPFHRVVHRFFPVCGGIVKMLTTPAHDDAIPSNAAPKPTIGKVIFAKRLPGLAFDVVPLATATPLRCDEDIGLHLLLTVLLI